MKRALLIAVSAGLFISQSILSEAHADTRQHDHENFKIEWKNRANALRLKNIETACRHGANIKSFLDKYEGQYRLDSVDLMRQRKNQGECEQLGYVFEPTIKAGDINAKAQPGNYLIDEGPNRNYYSEADHNADYVGKELDGYRKATRGITKDPKQACIHVLNIMEVARRFPLNVPETVKMEFKWPARYCKRDHPEVTPDIVFLP